ncbi:MAG: DUF1549 domain-containing protein [Planctomycetota bacterium]
MSNANALNHRMFVALTHPTAHRLAQLLLIALLVALQQPDCTLAGDAPAGSQGAAAAGPSFALQVLPILSDKCFMCHGPDPSTREAGLRLDTEADVLEVFAKGDFDASTAWERIHLDEDDELRMPPKRLGKSLTAKDIAILEAWMRAGTPWSGHWAFERIERPAVPDAGGAAPTAMSKIPAAGRTAEHGAQPGFASENNPIDAFVDRALQSRGWAANGPAKRETLARRVALDLTGLPPAPQQVDALLSDNSPDAWQKYVDALLASPHYAERMTVAWLDGARYADTNGYQNDFRRQMWPWRDWVIEAFASNMLFDQFTVEQLAGDMLPGATDSQRIASGFNRNNRTVTEAGSLPEEWLVENVVDRVETTGAVFLGLTLGCARCHDHKYDPISQRDFFSFFAFYHNVAEEGVYTEQRGNVPPLMYVLDDQQHAEHEALIAALEKANAEVAEAGSRGAEAAYQWATQLADSPPPPAPTPTASIDLEDDLTGRGIGGAACTPAVRGGDAAPITGGLLRAAAEFDGRTWLDYPSLFQPSAGGPFTLTAWVRRTGGGAIITKMASAGDGFRGFDTLLDGSGRLMVHLIGKWPQDALKATTREPIPAKAWTHLAVTYDGSRQAAGVGVFVNGEPAEVEINHDQLSGDFDTTAPVRLGRRTDGDIYRGKIARVAYHDRVLSGDEIGAVALGALASDTGIAAEHAHSDEHRDELFRLYAGLSRDPAAAASRDARRVQFEAKRSLESFRAAQPTVMVMQELPEPRDTYVLTRG